MSKFTNEEVVYGACTNCGKMVPIDDLKLPISVEEYYRTFLLKIEKGEFPVEPENMEETSLLCPECWKEKQNNKPQ